MGDNSKFDASLVTELAIAGSSTIGCFIRLNGPASQETIDSLRKIMDDNRDSSVSGLVSFNLQVGRDLGTFHAAPAQIQALSNSPDVLKLTKAHQMRQINKGQQAIGF